MRSAAALRLPGRRYAPVLLDLRADGSITLTTVSLLSAHLTQENHRELLENVRYKSRREVERLLAERRQPGDAAAGGLGEDAPAAPLLEHYTVTVPAATHAKLLWARDLLRHTIPTGDLGEVMDWALTRSIAELERAKGGLTSRPRLAGRNGTHSRHIPAAVRRAVCARDGGRCAFVGAKGRCSERGFLEFHHVVPFAAE